MRKPTKKQEQKLVDDWNRLYPVGTDVAYYSYTGAQTYTVFKTRGAAFFSHGGDPVIFLAGKSGYVALSHVRPLKCIGHQRSALAARIKDAVDVHVEEAARLGLGIKLGFAMGNERCLCATGTAAAAPASGGADA